MQTKPHMALMQTQEGTFGYTNLADDDVGRRFRRVGRRHGSVLMSEQRFPKDERAVRVYTNILSLSAL